MSKLKRLTVPVFWPIERKTKKYAVMPSPGPHSMVRCLPLGIILRDALGVAQSMKEAREILRNSHVKVNGRKRKRHNFPVGFMDVVEVGDEKYRALADARGLYLRRIEKEKEAGIKLCRVENKTCLSGGRLQLNLHDGSNIISDARCSTGDVVLMDMSGASVKEVLRLEKGSAVLITGGHNKGSLGKIIDIKVTRSPQPNNAVVALGDRNVSIPRNFVFVVGKEKPVIEIGA